MVGEPGGHHCWHKGIKKQDWSLPKLMRQNHNLSGRTYCVETKVELFGKGRHGTVYRKRNEAFKEKKHSPFSQTCWRFKESHWTPLERSQNSGWEKTSLKSERPGAVWKEQWSKIHIQPSQNKKVLVLCEFTHSRPCSIHKHTPDLSEQKWSKSPLNIFTFSHD